MTQGEIAPGVPFPLLVILLSTENAQVYLKEGNTSKGDFIEYEYNQYLRSWNRGRS